MRNRRARYRRHRNQAAVSAWAFSQQVVDRSTLLCTPWHIDGREARRPESSLEQPGIVSLEQRSAKGKTVFDAQVFVANVGAGKRILEFQKNQNVFAQGDIADTVFYIQRGKVKVTVLSDHGKEAVVGILGPGHFFGEGCMNGHKLRISTATAIDDCVITAITKDAMLAALHEPKFFEMFMAYLLTRNSRIEEDLIDQLFNSSERRLARILLLLANFGK